MERSPRRDLIAIAAVAIAATLAFGLWQGRREARQGEEIARLARLGDIRMVSSQTCVFCDRARLWFDTHHVAYSECFIERDGACAAQYRAQNSPGTPLIWVRGQPQLGLSPTRLLEVLREPARTGAPGASVPAPPAERVLSRLGSGPALG
jgi:glutaredoxin